MSIADDVAWDLDRSTKFDLLQELPLAGTHSGPTIALLPAGGVVWEDFLDTIGISLEQFCREGPGGWMLGYIDALRKIGVRTVLILLSASCRSPTRFLDRETGTMISVLPVPRTYRVWRRHQSGSGRRAQQSAGGAGGLRDSIFKLLGRVAQSWSTPVGLLARELRRERCQALLCQEYEYFRFDSCVMLGRLLRLPVLATFQGSDVERSSLRRVLRRLTMPGCRGLFVAPEIEILRVRSRYKLDADRVVQVFNPVDLDTWKTIDRDEARAGFDLSPEMRVAVWHGRVQIDSKGLDVLLEAWEQICRERPGQDLRLVLMGNGQDADAVDERIRSLTVGNVQWIREYVTDRSAILRLLSAGDVYAFPSRYEGFAVAPIEAMACGLPVVAARASGVADIFPAGEESGGLVVPCGDSAAFALALGRLLDDAAMGRELGRRGRRRVEQAFSLEAVGLQLHNFFVEAGFQMDDEAEL